MEKIKDNGKSKIFDGRLLSQTYSGALARPILARPLELSQHSSQPNREWKTQSKVFVSKARTFRRRVENIRAEKLKRLMLQFGIDPKDNMAWEKLATLLAIRDVPGMRIVSPHQTNRVLWSDEKLAELLGLVRNRSSGNRMSAKKAIDKLINEGLLSGDINSLYNRYLKAKSRPEIVARANRDGAITQSSGEYSMSHEMSAHIAIDMTHAFWEQISISGSAPTKQSDGWVKQTLIPVWEKQ